MRFDKVTSIYDYDGLFVYFGKVHDGNFFIAHDMGEYGGIIQYVNEDPDIGYDELVLSGEWLDKHTMGKIFTDEEFWNAMMDYLIKDAENAPDWDTDTLEILEARKYPVEPPYPEYIMRSVRERLGTAPNSTLMDAEIAAMDKVEVMRQWLEWEGICGYTSLLVDLVQDIFGVELK